MRKAVRISSCVLSLVLAASPCFADPFCNGLHKVAAAAPNEFRGMWDKKNPPEPMNSVAATYIIPGAKALRFSDGTSTEACSVNMTGGQDDAGNALPSHYFYFCEFPAQGGGIAASDGLAARVAGCLATQVPQPTENRSDLRLYDIVLGGIHYSVHGEDDSTGDHVLRVDIMQDFAPGQ